MTFDAILLLGALYAIATYLLMEKKPLRMVFGFILLSHASNINVLAMSLTQSDPLPQACILTAIVIGFSVITFLQVLTARLEERK